jgi:hypothetical protein
MEIELVNLGGQSPSTVNGAKLQRIHVIGVGTGYVEPVRAVEQNPKDWLLYPALALVLYAHKYRLAGSEGPSGLAFSVHHADMLNAQFLGFGRIDDFSAVILSQLLRELFFEERPVA